MKKILRFCVLVIILIFYCKQSFGFQVAQTFQFPLENYYVPCNDVGTKDECVKNDKWHLGEDASAKSGVTVYSIGNGVVKHAGDHPLKYDSSGNIIRNYGGMYIIEHVLPTGEKVCSLFAHMDFKSFTKKTGEEVGKSEALGVIGNYNQNGGWSEHLHSGVKKGAYPDKPNEYICGDWIFSGYTACYEVLNNWYEPTTFIQDHSSPAYASYNFDNRDSQGWTNGNDTEVYPTGAGEEGMWQVHITGTNPGIVSPVYNDGMLAEFTKVRFKVRATGNDNSVTGYLWFLDETGSWNNRAEIGLVDTSEEFKVYEVDLNYSWAESNTRQVKQISLELTDGGNGSDEFWALDWLEIVSTDPGFSAAISDQGVYPPEALVANTISSNRIDLIWEGSSSSYKVYRSTGVDSSVAVLIAAVSEENYSDTGLSQQTQYNYWVKAVSGVEASDFSNMASTITSPSDSYDP
ncbi:MAG: peptidoglycan DD-metalloendopeptidase family protein, partial [Candidatus Omnitrophica bacterium]|nr:peptidoglycan DD-metalloendopeptidase family protein [Candidatus Omnitrophota bacterium]